jgi:hypothetical protein
MAALLSFEETNRGLNYQFDMAEAIAFTSGIASVSQVLVYFEQITKYSISFYSSFTEAPRVLGQIREKLHILQQIIGQVESYTAECDDGDLLPTEIPEEATENVFHEIVTSEPIS